MNILDQRPVLARAVGLAPALGLIGIFMILPMFIVAAYSLMEAHHFGGVRPNFSIDGYVKFLYERDFDDTLLFDPRNMLIFLRSMWLALVAMVACLLVGFPVAYFMAVQPRHRRDLLVFLVTIPFWTNLLIRTFCWILILRDQGVINGFLMWTGIISEPITLLYTDFAIVLGLVYSYVPFMVLPIYASIEKLDLRLVEAAHDLYASRLAVLRHVILPLSSPGIIAGAILVFIPSLGTFLAPALLGGNKNMMIGSLIQFQFTAGRNWPFGSAAALILLAIVLLALVLYARGPAKKLAGSGHA